MTTFAVVYRPERVVPRMRTGLVGEGTVTLTATGLRLVGKQPRTTLANVVAGTVALVATFFALLFAMSALDSWIRGRQTMKLFVAIGLVVGVGVFVAVRVGLLKVLSLAPVDRTITFEDVTAARLAADGLELSTYARGFTGVTALTVAGDPAFLVDAVTAAKRGGAAGYRSP
ncbi:MAG: hypothetical protein U0414_15220 [Polyangiaceae bacterium]